MRRFLIWGIGVLVIVNVALGAVLAIVVALRQHSSVTALPSAVPPTRLPEPIPIPFHASSVGTDFALVGTVNGIYRVYPDRVEVTITEGRFWYSSSFCQHQACTFSGMQVGLGYSTDSKTDKWMAMGLTLPHAVDVAPSPDEVYLLHDWTFTVPVQPSTNLTHHWIVFRLSGRVVLPQGPITAYFYIHSDELGAMHP